MTAEEARQLYHTSLQKVDGPIATEKAELLAWAAVVAEVERRIIWEFLNKGGFSGD